MAPPPAEGRPLTARSVVATALLGARPPRLPVGRLVQAGSFFGIGEGAVRTALWRMVAAGELQAEGGWYRLAGRLVERKRLVDDSYAGQRLPWDGTWELAVVAADRREATARQELRSAARALHLGEVREGTWARPSNLDPERLPHHRAVVDGQCLRFLHAAAPAGLEARLFDLPGWATRAEALVDAMEEVTGPVDGATPEQLREGFLLSIAVVRHLQADPLLPDELLPADWPGDRLRRRYRRYDEEYRRRLTRSVQAPAPSR
jgi:phenylacetic acid degradation operon negative regulatory protein